jgi:hypothetical protein
MDVVLKLDETVPKIPLGLSVVAVLPRPPAEKK